MRRLVLSCVFLTGCPTPSPADAGADGGVDAPVLDGGSDAGPCGVCDTATPFCNTSMMCVECLEATDCTGAACVAGSCVACDTNDDCPAEMPQCSATNTCEACTGNDGCVGRDEGGVCDGGTCVECTMDDRTACTSGVCLLSTNTCAEVGGSTALCGDCTADTDCAAGQLCIPMTYDDPATPAADPVAVGNHCLWRSDASGTGAPNGDCFANARPYARTSMLTSVDGVTADVCTLAVSTCAAQEDFRMVNCMTLDAAGDALCGVASVPDGVCRNVSGTTNRCTVFCLSDDDCPGTTCAPGAVPRQCNL